MLDLPPGGLRTFTDVLVSLVLLEGRIWLVGRRGCWGTTGFTVGVGLLTGSGSPQASEKLLLPPGAWWTLTEVVLSPCFEKSMG